MNGARFVLMVAFGTVLSHCGETSGPEPRGDGDVDAGDGSVAADGDHDADADGDEETECTPRTSEQRPCGNCGDQTRTRLCSGDGSWEPWGECSEGGACNFRRFFPTNRFVRFNLSGPDAWNYEYAPWRDPATDRIIGTKICHFESGPDHDDVPVDIWFLRTDLDLTPGDVREESDWYRSSDSLSTWSPRVWWGDETVEEGQVVNNGIPGDSEFEGVDEQTCGGASAWTSTRIEALNQTIDVPAGRFTGVAVVFITQCIEDVTRGYPVRWDHRFWFAPDVGFVRMQAWSAEALCDAELPDEPISDSRAIEVGTRVRGETLCDPL